MIKYKLSSEFVIFENGTMQKKNGNSYCNAWYYIQWSHNSQYVEVDVELCLAPKMDTMAYEHRSQISHINKWSHMFHNFMNIPLWNPWKPEEFSFSLPVPRRAPKGVTLSINGIHCQLQ